MKTFNLCYRFTFLIIACSSCGFCMRITTSPTPKINKTDEIHNGTFEVIFRDKTVLAHERVDLVCEVTPITGATVVWMKENEAVNESQRVKFVDHTLIINQTTESDAGYYTCIVKTAFGTKRKTAYLTVTEDEESEEEEGKEDYSGDGHPCGRPEKRKFSFCRSSGFPNCGSFAPPVSSADIEIKKTWDEENSRLRMKIQWKLPKAGNSDIWGWQVSVADVGSYPGWSYCRRLNRKYLWESKDRDLYANYTLDETPLGTKLRIGIQSLPAMDNEGNLASITTTIETEDSLRKEKGHCGFSSKPDNCCYRAKGIVVEQVGPTSAKLTWPDLANSTIDPELLSAFVVQYNSTYKNDPCQERTLVANIEDALNKSHIMIYDLVPQCQNYSFKIIPLFKDTGCSKCSYTCDSSSKQGRSSKFYFFQMTIPLDTLAKYTGVTEYSSVMKAVVVVVVALSVTVLLVVVLIVRKKKRDLAKSKEADSISDGKPVTEVFVVHGSHCKDCEDAVLSVVTYLNLTGLCKCSIDLCSLPKEWSPGMTQYYENKIAECQKVIVLFTVNENCECEDSVKARNFAYQKNLIRSELYANRPTAKFIPVYMDFLSDLDVPCFLRNKKSFSLPTQLTELVLYIIGEPVCKPVSVCPMLSLEEDSSLMKHKKIMEAKIRDLNGKHQKKFKNKNNNTFAKIV